MVFFPCMFHDIFDFLSPFKKLALVLNLIPLCTLTSSFEKVVTCNS
ncbi:hypothetical protein X975_00689, partial [Stegodyphus mimosarum]